ncbi:hypothetical protein [Metallibacterium sp.]|uniref:hypothetical protein n=1 Tax=Metallibacterium sp. TaxID=2940281 RepID=UPI002639CE17|nr:hypothetical protein [Metallibacterium sp.]
MTCASGVGDVTAGYGELVLVEQPAIALDRLHRTGQQGILSCLATVGAGDMYRRRCDLSGFVNGLPLGVHRTEKAQRAAEERLRRRSPLGQYLQQSLRGTRRASAFAARRPIADAVTRSCQALLAATR